MGDIESMPFVEALRQFQYALPCPSFRNSSMHELRLFLPAWGSGGQDCVPNCSRSCLRSTRLAAHASRGHPERVSDEVVGGPGDIYLRAHLPALMYEAET